MRYYYLVVTGGVECDCDGPFDSAEERDNAAREAWATLDHNGEDNIFWCDVKDNGLGMSTGPYIEGDLQGDDNLREYQDKNGESP